MTPTTTSQVSMLERIPPELICKILLLAADSDVEDIDLDQHDYSNTQQWQLPNLKPRQGRRLKTPAQQHRLVCSTWMRIVTTTPQCWVTTISIRLFGPDLRSLRGADGLTDFEEGKLSLCKSLLGNSRGSDIDLFIRIEASHDENLQQSLAKAILPYSNQIRQLVIAGPRYHFQPTILKPLILSNQLTRLMFLNLHTREGPSAEWPTKETVFLPRLTAVSIGEYAFNFIKGAKWTAPNLRNMHMSVGNGGWHSLSAFFSSDIQLHTLVLRDESRIHGEPDVIPWKHISPEMAIRLPVVTTLDLRKTRSVDFGMGIIMLGDLVCLRELLLDAFLVRALSDLSFGERVQLPQVQLLTIDFLPQFYPLSHYAFPDNGFILFPNLHTLHLQEQSISQLVTVLSVVNKTQLKHISIAFGNYQQCHSHTKGRNGLTAELSSLEDVRLEGVGHQSFPAISNHLHCPAVKSLSISGSVTTNLSVLNSVWEQPAGRQWHNLEHFSITFPPQAEVETASLSCLSLISRLTSLEVVVRKQYGEYMPAHIDQRRPVNDWKSNEVIGGLRELRSLRIVVEGMYRMEFLESFLSFIRDLKVELQRFEIRSPCRPKGFGRWFLSIPEFHFDLINSTWLS